MGNSTYMVSQVVTSVTVSCSGWQLQLEATVQSRQAVKHVAWSPYDPCQAAFICQDGSLHLLQVGEHRDGAARLRVQVCSVSALHTHNLAM